MAFDFKAVAVGLVFFPVACSAQEPEYTFSPGENSLIQYQMRPTVTVAGEILEATVALHEILAALPKKQDLSNTKDVVVNWNAAVRDKYGNASTQGVVQLRFKNSELQKVSYANVSPQQLLDNFVTKVGTTKLGKSMLMEFCQEHMSTTPQFCKLAAKS